MYSPSLLATAIGSFVKLVVFLFQLPGKISNWLYWRSKENKAEHRSVTRQEPAARSLKVQDEIREKRVLDEIREKRIARRQSEAAERFERRKAERRKAQEQDPNARL